MVVGTNSAGDRVVPCVSSAVVNATLIWIWTLGKGTFKSSPWNVPVSFAMTQRVAVRVRCAVTSVRTPRAGMQVLVALRHVQILFSKLAVGGYGPRRLFTLSANVVGNLTLLARCTSFTCVLATIILVVSLWTLGTQGSTSRKGKRTRIAAKAFRQTRGAAVGVAQPRRDYAQEYSITRPNVV